MTENERLQAKYGEPLKEVNGTPIFFDRESGKFVARIEETHGGGRSQWRSNLKDLEKDLARVTGAPRRVFKLGGAGRKVEVLEVTGARGENWLGTDGRAIRYSPGFYFAYDAETEEKLIAQHSKHVDTLNILHAEYDAILKGLQPVHPNARGFAALAGTEGTDGD